MLYQREYRTRFNPATDTKGESITAFLVGFDGTGCRYNVRQKTMPYSYALGGYENHEQAINELMGEDVSLLMVKEFKRGYRFTELMECN
jgi:hypothetical protein